METNLTVANLQSDSAHDILQVYKQIHFHMYKYIYCFSLSLPSASHELRHKPVSKLKPKNKLLKM